MKNFAIIFTALAAITFVNSTTFAATPHYQPNQYQSRYYNGSSHRNWNDNYSYQSRDSLNRYRDYSNYDYLSNRSNSRSNYYRCGTAPSYTPSYYRANYSSYPYNSNRFDNRFDYGHKYNNYQRDYNRSNYDWRVGR